MLEIKRAELKSDPVWNKLFEAVKARHTVANHTVKVLAENKHIKDFCEEARHFGVLDLGGKPLFLHYDITSWYQSDISAAVKIEAIGIYDDFQEYETARMKELHSADKKDIPNIN